MRTKMTSRILEEISERLQGDIISDNEEKTLKALIVFNGSNIEIEQQIESIKKLKNSGIKISLAFSFMAEQILDTQKIINSLRPLNIYKEEDIVKLKNISREYSIIIGPNITINTLSKVSLGMIDNFISNLIWTFLYRGKKVYLDFNQVENYLGEETKNKEIQNQVNKHIDTVKKMGVIEINKENWIDSIINNHRDLQIYPKENITQSNNLSNYKDNKNNKTVITEKDIINLIPNQILTIPKGTIITPLAKDKVKEKNIKIEIK